MTFVKLYSTLVFISLIQTAAAAAAASTRNFLKLLKTIFYSIIRKLPKTSGWVGGTSFFGGGGLGGWGRYGPILTFPEFVVYFFVQMYIP